MVELVDLLNRKKKEKGKEQKQLAILGLSLYANVPDTKVRRHMQRYLRQSEQRQQQIEEN